MTAASEFTAAWGEDGARSAHPRQQPHTHGPRDAGVLQRAVRVRGTGDRGPRRGRAPDRTEPVRTQRKSYTTFCSRFFDARHQPAARQRMSRTNAFDLRILAHRSRVVMYDVNGWTGYCG